LNKIAESRAIEKTDYDHWVAEYTKTKTQLEEKKAETEAKITQLNTEIVIKNKNTLNNFFN
jgi:hypothetical protein